MQKKCEGTLPRTLVKPCKLLGFGLPSILTCGYPARLSAKVPRLTTNQTHELKSITVESCSNEVVFYTSHASWDKKAVLTPMTTLLY